MDQVNLELSDFDYRQAISVKQAAAMLRNHRGRPQHPNVLRRWARDGYQLKHRIGPPLKLPTIKLGRCLWLMPQWLEAFLQAQFAISKNYFGSYQFNETMKATFQLYPPHRDDNY